MYAYTYLSLSPYLVQDPSLWSHAIRMSLPTSNNTIKKVACSSPYPAACLSPGSRSSQADKINHRRQIHHSTVRLAFSFLFPVFLTGKLSSRKVECDSLYPQVL